MTPKVRDDTLMKSFDESLLLNKLFIPPLAQTLVARSRLITRLTEGVYRPLTLITALAGWDKTTLLATWRADSDGSVYPVAWVSLDTGDNDPVRIWTYSMTALNTLRAGMCDTTLAMLRSPQPPPMELVLTALLNALTNLSTDAVFILDDYHEISVQAIHDTLTFFLNHLPQRLHVVIASRVDPHLPLARLRARGQLIELRATQLRFTTDEATAFLKDVMNLPLTAFEIETLEARTEGWIAGLQLVALSITYDSNGNTVLCGPLIDKAALHSVLMKVRDLGVPLLAMNRVIPDRSDPQRSLD